MVISTIRALRPRDKMLCALYASLALTALVLTQWQLFRFLGQPDNGGVRGFITDGFVNPAAAFLSTDLLIVAVAALIFMVAEARRTGVRLVWLYVAISILVAISVGFPLFLLARQITLAGKEFTRPAAP